jgi:two-component system response regulator TctD
MRIQPTTELPLVYRHILVVDNDLAHHIAFTLREAGCAGVDIALDGVEAIACLSRQSYDLIVLNYHMPRMNGAVFLRRIRERGDRTPVVMVSAWDPDQIPEPLADLDIDDFVEKSFSNQYLVTRIAQTLRRHGR